MNDINYYKEDEFVYEVDDYVDYDFHPEIGEEEYTTSNSSDVYKFSSQSSLFRSFWYFF